jgi:hypothetical protein
VYHVTTIPSYTMWDTEGVYYVTAIPLYMMWFTDGIYHVTAIPSYMMWDTDGVYNVTTIPSYIMLSGWPYQTIVAIKPGTAKVAVPSYAASLYSYQISFPVQQLRFS